tara:strand:+ start:1568 stop:2512 length:945 start_codon:yes stop_codon:yes gene_type:complete
MASSLTKISTVSGVATGVGANVLTAILGAAADQGVSFVGEALDRAAVEANFDQRLSALPQGKGALFGFVRFRAPDGQILEHGPIPMGEGTRPADPLVSLGFSNRAAAQMGVEAVAALQPPAGTQWQGMSYYWATRTAEGIEVFHVDDSSALQAEAIGSIYRQQALPILASRGDALTKLTRQAELFDSLEDQMRDELRSAGIEAELTGIRQQMRQADALFRRAQADREAALARAESAKGLQEVTQLFGLAANFTGFVDTATAQADYATSEQVNATNTYNVNVTRYILLFQQNTTINSSALPSAPTLPAVPVLPLQ